MRNRYAAACTTCSVTVQPGGGSMRRTNDGWLVHCPTCQAVEELQARAPWESDDWTVPTSAPETIAATVALRILALTRACWRCATPTTCLVGLYPQRPGRGYIGLFTTESEDTMILVRDLLIDSGHPHLTATIKPRYSQTTRSRTLTNGCPDCDALMGNFFVGEEAFSLVVNSGIDALTTLAVVECPVARWHHLMYGTSPSAIGI